MPKLPSFLVVAAVAAVACSDSFKPTTENVAGDYSARTFTSTDTTGTIDWIQRGGALTISLGPSGTLTGHLFLPGGGEAGGDLDTPLLGNWTLAGSRITFDMPAIDTFVRDMPWTATENQLAGDHAFSGTRIKVVLTK
jgi:hypothetical protein